jgi:hypothetical protein
MHPHAGRDVARGGGLKSWSKWKHLIKIVGQILNEIRKDKKSANVSKTK